MKKMKLLAIILPITAIAIYFGYQKYPVNPPIKITSSKYIGELKINELTLPEGFAIDVYAEDVPNARSMALSKKGTLFVGSRDKGNVYALQDTNQDGKIDKKYTLLTGGTMPNGVALRNGDLYIAEVSRILKISDVESKLENPGTPEVVYDHYPSDTHHGWKYIAFGPDDRLYVPVGAPCNICESEKEIYASITSIKPDGSDMRIEQKGIRNTVGFGWHPQTGELWFTDNGRDWMGDDKPECELNKAEVKGQHFGYPYCHQGNLLDDEFGEGKNCDQYTPPMVKLGPHTAPLGLEFYTKNSFPKEYKNDIFVARHGSWNRKKKIGYDIVRIQDNGGGNMTVTPFITGWLQNEDVWGRPVDIEFMEDGSMLISDDYANAIYRVYYRG